MTEIEEQILVPTVHGMRRRRTPFHGILYAGLMLTSQGPKVLEFNVRFGDPECQALCIRLESSLLELIDAAVDRRLNEIASPTWKSGASVTVVMASEDYPDTVEKGHAIRGLSQADELENVVVFHAATTTSPDDPETVLTTGGRVLGVTAHAESLARAKLRAYEGVKEIRWRGAWCRKDIADKGLRHEQEQAATESTDSSSQPSEGTA